MDWSDVAKILFGAGLGFVIAFGQALLAQSRRRKEVIKLISIQLPSILTAIEPMVRGKLMPDTDLPSLGYIGPTELIALSTAAAREVYQLREALARAEMSRMIASASIRDQQSPQFQAHSIIFSECLGQAIDSIRALQKKL